MQKFAVFSKDMVMIYGLGSCPIKLKQFKQFMP